MSVCDGSYGSPLTEPKSGGSVNDAHQSSPRRNRRLFRAKHRSWSKADTRSSDGCFPRRA